MRPLWILDTYLLERSTPTLGPSFAEAVALAGCDVSVHSWDTGARKPSTDFPAMDGRPVIGYGSFAFVKHMLATAKGAARPGSYARTENLAFHAFAAHVGDLLLNDDFHILPFGELARRAAPARDIFVRPDRVTKSFTGFAVSPENYAFEIGCLDRVTRVGKEELVVVADAKRIDLECRYVIADGQVVAGSTYGWEDDFRPSPATDPRCDAVAREMAGREWQPDTVYTCDVGICEGRARIVELNSFSCAGLYACNTRAVAEAVTACMRDEYGLG